MLPILLQTPEFILYSYPFLMGLGWGVGYQVYFTFLPEGMKRMDAQLLFWGIFLFAWLGAKTLFLLTYPKSSQLLSQVSFWTGGGFVFYGGLVAGLSYFLTFYRLRNLSPDILLPLISGLTFGHAVGRIGCFLAGCCYGKETGSFWGVYLHEAYRHPTQLLEAAGLLTLGFFFLKVKWPRIILLAGYFIGYGILRILVESLRGDIVRGEWFGASPSQWISGVFIVSGLILLHKNKHLRLFKLL